MSAALFPLLLAGRLIGDWVLQTDYQATHKSWPIPLVDKRTPSYKALRSDSWLVNQQHMATYHVPLAAAALTAGLRAALVIVAVSWVTHSFIDRRWPVRWLMVHTGSGPFSETWGVIAVDQALHLTILSLLGALYA